MKKTIETKPTARIAVKKNVIKHYNINDLTTVYLTDETEFEIELFNPLQETILCKFEFNGKSTNGEGLVLKPGQRVFLERYLDNDNKYKFSTYNVENTDDVKNAISKNGLLEIKFYKEKSYTQMYYQPWTTTFGGCSTAVSAFTTTCFYNSCDDKSLLSMLNDIETGRIEKGKKSNQEFEYINQEFYDIPFHSELIKILPDSSQIFTLDDIKHKRYCSNCGNKIKEKDKFCSNCGTKI